MSRLRIRSTARRLAKAAAVSALSAALAVTLLAAPALAAPAEGDATPSKSVISSPVAWLSGLIHDLIDPLVGSPPERPFGAPNDLDRVEGTVGSGFDPSGHTGEPPEGQGRPGKPGRT